MKTAIALATVGLLCCANCGGTGSAPTAVLAIEITSHSDLDQVTGIIQLTGTVLGGSAEIAYDDQPYVAASGDTSWSIALDSNAWSYGWHTLQARVRAGTSQALHRISLFASTGVNAPPVPPVVIPPPPKPSTQPDSGLVAHWSFDEPGGELTIDSSRNSNQGRLYGGVSHDAGMLGGALLFDGVDGQVAVTDLDQPPPTAIGDLTSGSISVWFRYASVLNGGSTADFLPILYYGADSGMVELSGGDSLAIYVGHGQLGDPTQRQIYFTILHEGFPRLCFDSGAVSLDEGRWYHYAVSVTPGEHRAYLNGQPLDLHYNAGSGPEIHAFFTSVADDEICRIGYGAFGASRRWWHFNGHIDDLRIYDRTLTTAEILDLSDPGGT